MTNSRTKIRYSKTVISDVFCASFTPGAVIEVLEIESNNQWFEDILDLL